MFLLSLCIKCEVPIFYVNLFCKMSDVCCGEQTWRKEKENLLRENNGRGEVLLVFSSLFLCNNLSIGSSQAKQIQTRLAFVACFFLSFHGWLKGRIWKNSRHKRYCFVCYLQNTKEKKKVSVLGNTDFCVRKINMCVVDHVRYIVFLKPSRLFQSTNMLLGECVWFFWGKTTTLSKI